ncbi:MAG: addiction module antitoxin RelB [Deltaproteobacteria bacterium]|nr:MAG: addiction module antitoxin RelB [Deltaproteobacteria bacterium]TMB58507.1 MAG: addiction module antitoxin RelB [Deltaproteobacteria bacterium]
MADPARELESKVLKLPARARARLAVRLIDSLDPDVDPHSEALWLKEAERRLRELRSGTVAGIPAKDVFRKARSTLR